GVTMQARYRKFRGTEALLKLAIVAVLFASSFSLIERAEYNFIGIFLFFAFIAFFGILMFFAHSSRIAGLLELLARRDPEGTEGVLSELRTWARNNPSVMAGGWIPTR